MTNDNQDFSGEDLDLLQQQCGLDPMQLAALQNPAYAAVHSALAEHKTALSDPDGNFDETRKRLRLVVNMGLREQF